MNDKKAQIALLKIKLLSQICDNCQQCEFIAPCIKLCGTNKPKDILTSYREDK